MFPQYCSKLAQLLGVIALAFPLTAFSMIAGRADFVVGKVEATTADGARRTLIKGSEINAGETINTDVNARAQIRFIDGGFISLQPNTVFRVDEFNYQNKTDGGERSFFSLLKGGLRAITGAIGHTNRDTYRVNTPVATIGIRGTGYNAMLSDGLFVNVGEGTISLTNNAGLLLVSAGGAAFVANINTPPAPTAKQPQMPPAGLHSVPDDLTYIVSNDRDPGGSLSILPHLASGSGYSMSYAYTQCSVDGCFGSGSGGLTNVTASFSDTSQLQEYQTVAEVGKPGAGAVAYAVTDGIIGWGRWVGNTVTTGSIPSLNPGVFDYVIGIPTATMPTSGTATYALLGGTTPTSTDRTLGWNISGTLSTSFSANPTIGVNLVVANPSLPTPVAYNISGSLIGSGATFSTGAAPLAISSSQTSCALGCTASINGFFAGASAERVGLTYNINELGVRNVAGAAAFASNGITIPRLGL